MAGDLNALPGGQVAVECLAFLLKILPCGLQEGVLGGASFGKFRDAAFEVGDGEFKVERLDIHDREWFVKSGF
jgi:hypothetical protein